MNTIWTLLVLFTIVFSPLGTIRLLFIVIGWFFVPLTLLGDGAERTPRLWRYVYGNVEDIVEKAKKNRWTKYVEMAWRNPTNGMAGWVKQPIPEKRPNPDELVRDYWFDQYDMKQPPHKSASRFMRSGWFWEYWYLRSIDLKIWAWVPLIGGKHYRWFEFRIGWKFVDGNDEFFPTFQLGPRSS